VQYDSADPGLITLTRLNESSVESPPFSSLCFEVSTSSHYSLDSHDVDDPIRQINARYQEEPEVTFKDNEEKIVTDFCQYVLAKDPSYLLKTVLSK
jgi:DNA polymerase elongation subunit (family B)